jgi:hypothetical protein
MLTTPLPAGAGYRPSYSPGLLAHLPAVVAQFVEARQLSPLRVLLTGPPYSGGQQNPAGPTWYRRTALPASQSA